MAASLLAIPTDRRGLPIGAVVRGRFCRLAVGALGLVVGDRGARGIFLRGTWTLLCWCTDWIGASGASFGVGTGRHRQAETNANHEDHK